MGTLQSQKTQEADSITRLDEVVLRDTLAVQSATGITPSEILGPATFQNYSPVEMVSAMNEVPGVYVLSGALNTNRITIRGIGARTLFGTDKLRMYYNDIPVTNGTGTSEIEAFDLENLGQIEIIKGPKGTAFGSNLGGAIVLSPKKALLQSTTLRNSFNVGSYGLIKNNLALNHFDGKLRLNLQYGHMEIDGYRENNRFERDGVLLNASYLINDRNKMTFLVNHIDYSAQIASSLGATVFAENPRQAAFTWGAAQGFEANNLTLVGLNYVHTFGKKLKNSTSIFYSYLDHYEPRPFGILDEFTHGYGFRTRFSGSMDFFGIPTEYTLGAELFKDEYNWDEFENLYRENNGNGSLQGSAFAANKEFRTQLNGFATWLLSFTEIFSAQLGLAVNKTDYDFRDLFNTGPDNQNAERDFSAIVLPSLDLNYNITGNHTLFANLSRGFSNPTVAETLTPDGVINPDIAQETGFNYELGTQWYANNRKLRLDLAVYRMDVRNLLVAERVNEDQFIGRNAGKTRHRGLEAALRYRFTLSPNIQLSPFANYTFNDHEFVEFVDGGDDFSGNPLTGVPKHRITSGLQGQFFRHFYCNLTHQYVGSIPLTDANTISSDSFHVFNMRMGFQQRLTDTFSLGLDLGIQNLGDTLYAQSVLINAPSFGGNEPRYFYPG
ncbi:MAG: TonB-dependent receptor, partial [Bacteroidota bacterium]